jgi:hypothetical protein
MKREQGKVYCQDCTGRGEVEGLQGCYQKNPYSGGYITAGRKSVINSTGYCTFFAPRFFHRHHYKKEIINERHGKL